MTIAGPDPLTMPGPAMVKILLIQPRRPPLESPENLSLALTLLARAFDYYLPVVGVNTAAFIAEIHRRRYAIQGGHSFAIQPPAPADAKTMGSLIRGWDDLRPWVVLSGGEEQEILEVSLDLHGPRRWRPEIRERFGITL